jgi:hypothetical protein
MLLGLYVLLVLYNPGFIFHYHLVIMRALGSMLYLFLFVSVQGCNNMASISGRTDSRVTNEYWINGLSDYQIDLKRKDGVWGVAKVRAGIE